MRGARHLALAEKFGAGVAKIAIDKGQRLLAHGNDAFLVALANAADITSGAVEIHHPQAGQF